MIEAYGYAARRSFSRLKPLRLEREEAGPDEVEIEILYCGVCHSDIHQCENDWGSTVHPCMPGHEIVGRVTGAGDKVTRHKVGDLVGGRASTLRVNASAWRRARWDMSRSVSTNSIATSEWIDRSRGVVRRGACRLAWAASSSRNVRSPRRRSPASQAGRFITRKRCFGMR